MRDLVILAVVIAVALEFTTAIIVLFSIYVVGKLLLQLLGITYSWLRYSDHKYRQESAACWEDYQKALARRTSRD